MKILVTGGCGFIGSNLVDYLVNALKHDVTVIDNLSSGDIKNVNVNASYIYDDLLTYEFTDGFDIIYHLAAPTAHIQYANEYTYGTLHENINGVMRMCELAKRWSARLIYAGSVAYYTGRFTNPYSFSKTIGEEICKLYSMQYDIDISIGRFFNVYGNRQRTIGKYTSVVAIFDAAYKAGKPLPIIGDGKQKRDFINVYDVVSFLINRLPSTDNKFMVYDVRSGHEISINELAKLYNTQVEYIDKRDGEIDQVDITDTGDVIDSIYNKYTLENHIANIIL